MKKFLRFGAASAVVAASLGMSTVANAQDSASADAFAEILTALTLEFDTGSPLDFGAMVVTGAGGVVSLDASTGTLDCSIATIVCSGTTGLAAFSITAGTPGKNVTINFDTPSVKLFNLAGTGAAYELELGNFNSDAPEVTDSTTFDTYYEVGLDGGGLGAFLVGGDLTFDGTEVPGLYEGTFDVSVEYS
jgi:hypothetical protein